MPAAQDLIENALDQHRAGRLLEAERIYRQVLTSDSGNSDALHLLGLIADQAGRSDVAVKMISRAIRIWSTVASYHSNLGNALIKLRRTDEAVTSFKRALCIRPGFAEAHYNLGIEFAERGCLHEALAAYSAAFHLAPTFSEARSNMGGLLQGLGRWDDAVGMLRTAISLKPDFAEAYANLGIALCWLLRFDEAAATCVAALRLRPDDANAHNNLGLAWQGVGRSYNAAAAYRVALCIEPASVEAQVNLGGALYELDRFEQSEAVCRRAIRLSQDNAKAQCNLGNSLKSKGCLDRAIAAYRAAICLQPDLAEAYSNLGNASQDLGQFNDALLVQDTALRLKPDYADACVNRGNVLTDLGRLDDAAAAYGAALRIEPDLVEAHFSYGNLLLLAGRFEEGWPEYEWRWKKREFSSLNRNFGCPLWQGEFLEGKTVLLHAEQGMGDAIQFSRFVPMVAARGGRVVLEVPRSLIRLLSGLTGVELLVARGDPLPPVDLHCPLMSLPRAFGIRAESIPAPIPYLAAEPERVARWRARIRVSGFRVGVVWQGSPTYKSDGKRSAPLACFAPLARVPGVRLISLQKRDGLDQLDRLPAGMAIETLGPDFDEGPDGFLDTAAVVMCLDLIVTVDSAVGHLAGALGRPVWLALSKLPHWPWLLGRDDTPWYPNTRLFRQETGNDWGELFEAMAWQLRPLGQFDAAFRHHQAEELNEAERLYRQVLALDPSHADALQLLGSIADRVGRSDIAVTLIARAIAIVGTVASYHSNLGIALTKLRHIDEAVVTYKAAIGLRPDFPEAHFNLGIALNERGHFNEAVLAYSAALHIAPGMVEALSNLGGVLQGLGHVERAALSLRAAISVRPDFVAAYSNLAAALCDLRDFDQAAASSHVALRLQSDDTKSLSNLGLALQGMGRHTDAAAVYRIALCVEPDSAEALINLGVALYLLGHFDQSETICRTVIRLRPGNANAYCNLGNPRKEVGRLAAAIDAYRAAICVSPDYAEAYSNLGNVLQDLARFESAIAAYNFSLRVKPDYTDSYSNLLMCLHYRSGLGGDAILTEARRFADLVDTAPVTLVPYAREPDRRLRIGYVSGDFRNHPVGYFLRSILECHDPAEVEVVCYSNNPYDDAMTGKLKAAANRWRSLVGVSDARAAELVAADAIDILVDLSGHTAHNRLPLFASKPAPVQITWLGFWGTTGLSSMDYILSDDITIPPEEECFYSEAVIRLPGGRFCYRPPDYAPPVRLAAPKLDRAPIFGSFNNLAKVGPAVVELWAKVLLAVPGSKLVLKWKSLSDPDVCRRLTESFAECGIGAERLDMRAASPHAEMLAEYGDIDIALDPFPFSGGLTSCEALWMGVPIVTLPMKGAASRQTAGFLSAIGHEEWISSDEGDYLHIAAELAHDRDRLDALRQSLRRRMAESPLCDGPGFTRRLEEAYRRIWRNWSATAWVE